MLIKATHLHTKSLLAAAALGLASLATTTHAQAITDSFNYQGELIESGTPANGLYDITFVVYNSPTFGVAVSTTTVPNVEVVDGRFEVFVDFGTSGVTFDSDNTRWLQLQITEAGQPGFTVLAPRQRMSPAPVANYALRSGFAEQTNTSLQDAYDNGSTILRGADDSAFNIQSLPSLSAWLTLGDAFGGSGPGLFVMYDDVGGLMFTVERDTSGGGGGFLQIARNEAGNAGLSIDGNAFGTESTRLQIFGESLFMRFDTSTTGNNSVQLPNDAINSVEILNETGLAEAENTSLVNLTNVASTVDIVDTVTINCPAAGFVFVIGSAELSISHAGGTSSSVNVGVSNNSSSIPANGDHETRIFGTLPTGGYEYAVTTHGVFPVSAGVSNFFFLGDKNTTTGSASMSDTQLTAIYIPTAYGSTNLNSQSTASLPDDMASFRSPLTNQDILIEQNRAIIANNQRLERELDQMKTQMQQVLEQNERILSEQSQD